MPDPTVYKPLFQSIADNYSDDDFQGIVLDNTLDATKPTQTNLGMKP